MADWQKEVDPHVYDWQFFDFKDKTVLKIIGVMFVLGIMWGVVISKVWPGLPGDKLRRAALDCTATNATAAGRALNINPLCIKLEEAGIIAGHHNPAPSQPAPVAAPAPAAAFGSPWSSPKPSGSKPMGPGDVSHAGSGAADLCAADYAAWEAMPDGPGGSPAHNAKMLRRVQMYGIHGQSNFKAGCHD